MVSVTSLATRIDVYVMRYIDDSSNCFDILAELAQNSVSGANGLTICLHDEPDDKKILAFSKADIARAIIEGAIALLKEKLDELKAIGINPKSAVMVGGPSRQPICIRIMEEMCGLKVRVVHGVNAGAVGAAMIAGIGAGIYKGEADANYICNERE